jgi:hypothetical protein
MAGKLDTPLGISAEHPSFKPGNAGKARTFPHNSGFVTFPCVDVRFTPKATQ